MTTSIAPSHYIRLLNNLFFSGLQIDIKPGFFPIFLKCLVGVFFNIKSLFLWILTALPLANLFLYSYKAYFIQGLLGGNEMKLARFLRTKLYDKRDDFNFPIVNFPFICSNIPTASSYGVYISQLIRYSRACGSYQGFLDRGLPPARKLLTMAWLTVMICSTCRNHNLVLSSFMTYHRVCNNSSTMEQELFTLPNIDKPNLPNIQSPLYVSNR